MCDKRSGNNGALFVSIAIRITCQKLYFQNGRSQEAQPKVRLRAQPKMRCACAALLLIHFW